MKEPLLADEPPNGIAKALATVLMLAFVVVAGTIAVRSCVAQRRAAALELEAIAFERGMTFGLDLAARVEPLRACVPVPLPAELSALVACRGAFDDYRRTAAANRENARLRGWNEGYGLGRGDWKVQPWECRTHPQR